MSRLADLVTRRPLLIVVLVLLVSAAAGTQLPRLAQDDDVTRLLPAGDPAVQAFDGVARRFGAMNVALVAVKADGSLFTHDGLALVRGLTRRLAQEPAVAHVTSFTELAVVEGHDGEGAQVQVVPAEIPTDDAALREIDARVGRLDYLEGVLVAKAHDAALLVVQLHDKAADGTPIGARRAADLIRAAAADVPAVAGVDLHFGGAPFITEAAAAGAQSDMARLGPFVGVIVVLVVMFALGLLAGLYALLTIGLGVVWTLGLIAALGVPLTLVSSSLPVVLVALGSAYAIHVAHLQRVHADVRRTLGTAALPIAVAALVTIAAFLCFRAMDSAPLRELGWQMALGTAFSALLSLTFLPALFMLRPVPARAADPIARAFASLSAMAGRQRVAVVGAFALLAAIFASRIPTLSTHADPNGLFAPDSEPARAGEVLVKSFGGALFLQVLVDADIHDPAVLDRLAAFEDRLAGVPGTSRPQGIADVLAVVHEGLKGQRRLSRSRPEIEQLGFLAAKTDPSVSLLVDADWKGALIQIGITDPGRLPEIIAEVRALAADHLAGHAAAVPRASDATYYKDTAERLAALAGDASRADRLQATLATPIPAAERDAIAKAIHDVVQAEIIDNEMVALADATKVPDLEKALVALALALTLDRPHFDPLLKSYLAADELKDADELARSEGYLFTQLQLGVAPALRRYLVDALGAVTGPLDPLRAARLAAIADDVLQPQWFVSSTEGSPIAVTVTGQPLLQDAMSAATIHDLARVLLIALPLAFVLFALYFRSIVAALIALVPAALTLVATFGVMALLAIPVDVSAAMLVALGLGVGFSIAVTRIAQRDTPDGAGRAIAATAVEIAAGFGVLALASMPAVARFGALTALTLVAAVATLILLPALFAWWNPRRPAPLSSRPHGERT